VRYQPEQALPRPTSAVNIPLHVASLSADEVARLLTKMHQHRNNNNNQPVSYNTLAVYLLRTSECAAVNPLVNQFDDTLREDLTKIMNIDLIDDQWLQVSLPVGDGGLRVRSAGMMAPSAASILMIQQASLHPANIMILEDLFIKPTEVL